MTVTRAKGGVEIANPNHVATQKEFDDFNLKISQAKGQSMNEVPLTPPLFRFMEQKGLVGKVPFDAKFLAQDTRQGFKTREECHRFAQNPNFVVMDELTPGYHAIVGKHEGDGYEGDGYRVSAKGKIYFPVVYYVTTSGAQIICTRMYVTPKLARKHLQAGTADILGRRAKKEKREKFLYRYFIRTYTVASCKPDQVNNRSTFSAADYKMEGRATRIGLGGIVLTTFVGPRPEGHIVQHDDECYNNALECIRWIPFNENYLKENLDPE